MHYLHAQSVVHGDLKASNVLLKSAYHHQHGHHGHHGHHHAHHHQQQQHQHAPDLPSQAVASGGADGGDGASGSGAADAAPSATGAAASGASGAGGSGGSSAGGDEGGRLIRGGWVVAKICDFGLSAFVGAAARGSTALSTQICGGTVGGARFGGWNGGNGG